MSQPGSLVTKKHMDLLCIYFRKIDPSQGDKENLLVLSDGVSKFSQAFVTPNQEAATIAKVLTDKWFGIYSIPSQIHSGKGCSFQNKILVQLYSMYSIRQFTTTP